MPPQVRSAAAPEAEGPWNPQPGAWSQQRAARPAAPSWPPELLGLPLPTSLRSQSRQDK